MPMSLLRGLHLASLAVLALLMSCATQSTTSASGALYVYDSAGGATSRVLVWDDLDSTYSETGSPTCSRQLAGPVLDKMKNLAWGGMCLDKSTARLFLVNQSGEVAKLERIRNLSGYISNIQDIISFRLGQSSERLTNGTFGQASVDSRTGFLYVTETSDSDTRIWKVDPAQMSDGAVIAVSNIVATVSGDYHGTGVALVPGGTVFAYFGNGSTIRDPSLNGFDGPRLRMGTSSGFATSTGVIIGSSTQLSDYGALAFDNSTNRLYLGRHLTDSGVSGAPILAFTSSQFNQTFNQAPTATLGDSSLSNIRVIAHSGIKSDWLVASSMVSGVGDNVVRIWKTASQGGTYKSLSTGTGVSIRGLAIDGSN
jgi:hypothetical protein